MHRITFAIVTALCLCAPGGCPAADTHDHADDSDVADGGSAAGGDVTLGVDIELADEGRQHVAEGTQVNYTANPPASGSHWPTPAVRGFYDPALDEERWVHNLEHGYVVVLFDCNGDCDAAFLDDLRRLLDVAPASARFGYNKVVITPYDSLPAGALVALVAWNHQKHLAAYDEAVALEFYNQYVDQGPEDAP